MKASLLADFNMWHRVALSCDHATFFHRPEWYSVFAATQDGAVIETWHFEWDSGTIAVWPFLRSPAMLGLGNRYESAPAGCYGGWISPTSLESRHVLEMMDWARQHVGNLVWRINPFDPNLAVVPRIFDLLEDETQVIRLRGFADEKALLSSYKPSARNKIAKARRAGFTFGPASSWADWESYLALYEAAIVRWGAKATSHYSSKFFRTLFDLQDSHIRLWLVRHDEQVVGGNLNLYHGTHCVEWHAAFDPAFFKFGVRNFLVHQVILDAFSKGFATYDFNPSGGHEGVAKFKSSFGAEALPCPSVIQVSTLAKLSRRAKTGVIRGQQAIANLLHRGA